MTYHRTGGKGGTRNSPQERHIDEYAPNFNKTQGSGRVRQGRKQNNPPKKLSAAERRQRYDRMMGDRETPPNPEWTKGDEVEAQFASRVPIFGIGRSKVTGKRGKYK